MDRQADTVLDEYLVLAARAGSGEAFRALARRWTPRLLRHAQRVLRDAEAAADAVQEAWLQIARGLRRLEDPARFPGWAYAIVSRRCADEIRRGVRRRALSAAAEYLQRIDGETRPSEPEAALDLAAALGRLAPDQRLLVSLHYGEGLSMEAIAAALGVPAGTVKSRLHAARQFLKLHLEGDDHVAT